MRAHGTKALVASLALVALGAAACGSGDSGSDSDKGGKGGGTKGTGAFASCSSTPNSCNSGKAKAGGTFTYTIEKEVTGWNVNSSNTNTFDIVEVIGGISPGVFTANPDFKPALNKDLMVSATQAVSGGVQTLTYKINPKAVWNDGVPVNADDFQYYWKTSNTKDCTKCAPASTGGYDLIDTITPQDNGKTVVVKMQKPYADWQSMFGNLYPAHLAAKHGDIKTAAGLASSFEWFDKTVPTWSAGPYVISAAKPDTSVTEVPNPKWYGTEKPSLSKLIFRIITDQNQEVPALENNEVQAIYPQPNADIVKQTGDIQDAQYFLGKGLNWEHLDFNTVNPVLKDVKLRTAIFTAISQKDIITRTIGQFVPGASPMGNHMFVPGQVGYKDNTTSTKQGSGDVDAAKKILQDAGYTGVGSTLKNKSGQAVNIRCTFTTGNTLRQQTCQIVQTQLKKLGVKVTLDPTDDLGGTLDKGDFDLILFAWVSTPYVASGAQQIWTIKGGADYGKNNDPAMEAKITQASQATSTATRNQLLDQADVMLTKDAYVLPLFQKPTFLATKSTIVNVRDNATSVGPPYNVQQWGVKS
ncbi:peptide/nickel transport system substrate-binding protein [Jatrophihabitans endophyticus]|uniref:Peptide/nickel transport system substrate-binding protein n=1 Tax=Jatrophihabitans endophyticus TaxID=1206085 RepID=A0A1M5T8S3_9ACTN|nr:ABC transporter family substrate-binding protein [Jatrophihabitans endophyticus]SHH47121.1 peptide/nickel transport system substrate-binding protein [Jatrophihabitans endophyticus]